MYGDYQDLDASSSNDDNLSSADKTQESGKNGNRVYQRNTPTSIKQFFDGVPKVACAVVAVWDYMHTGDFQRFVLLLAVGYTADLPRLKTLVIKALTK